MTRKNYLLIVAAAAAFANCANDEVIVNNPDEGEITGAPITFGSSNVSGQTRATLSGNDAASKLNNEFVVFGTKHSADEDGTAAKDNNVFVNYKVVYDNANVGKSETNTNSWEYVGQTPYDKAKVAPAVGSQAVKYWDYSAPSYTFTAFAGKAELEANHVTVTKLLADPNTTSQSQSKYNKGYTVTATKDAVLDNMYYSDRMVVEKSKYDKPVVLTFRNFGSRVRVGFYETVPGYKVHIDNFYFDSDADAAVTTFKAMDQTSTTNFKAALWNVNTTPAATTTSTPAVNTLTVTYSDNNSGIENQPKVTNTTVTYTGTLSLGTNITAATALSESPVTPTWDTPLSGSSTEGKYTTVYPNEACANPMLIRCDYTLTSDDESGETIKVKNARVVVPAEYCQWKPNFAYTYLFKISDNTNGTTGNVPSDPDDPSKGDAEGLHPITFDAVVIDVTTGNQETITTVSTNSITTYAKNSSLQGEYKAGETIYVVDENTSSHTVITPTNIGAAATQAQVYKLNKAATESEVIAQLNGSPLGITMEAVSGASIVNEVPSSNDTKLSLNAVKFASATLATGVTAEYYAYVYTKVVNQKPEYTKVGGTTTSGTTTSSAYSSSTTYFYNTADDATGVYYAASGIDENNFANYKDKLYTKTSDGTVGQYDVKVITVK